jgi:hypothetical protein
VCVQGLGFGVELVWEEGRWAVAVPAVCASPNVRKIPVGLLLHNLIKADNPGLVRLPLRRRWKLTTAVSYAASPSCHAAAST